MKGNRRLVSVMKKWCMIAVVFALAMSLTSCARRKPDGLLSTYGLSNCYQPLGSYALGQFDVWTFPVSGQSGTYKIVVIPYGMDAEGDVIAVHVVNSSTLQYKPLVTETSAYVDQEIVAGYLSEAELNSYDRIVISSADPSKDFMNANPEKDVSCTLPLIGDDIQ